MDGGLPLPWVPAAEQGVPALDPHRGGAPRGFGGANTAQTPAGKQWLHAGLGKGVSVLGEGSLVPPAPAARGFFLLPRGQEGPMAVAQLFLPCPGVSLAPHLQVPKGFLGSLVTPLLHLGFVFNSYLFLDRFVPVIAAVPGPAFQQVCSAERCRLAMRYDKAFI